MNKQILFNSIDQVKHYRQKITKTTNEKMNVLLQSGEGIEFLKKIKFSQCGYDPLFEEPMNFIEQTNQTFTYLVCLSAVEILLSRYPTYSFLVNFGTQSGFDVVSEDSRIICECFAATSPDSNRKLEQDTIKVNDYEYAAMKFVIFYASISKIGYVQNLRNKYRGVELIPLDEI